MSEYRNDATVTVGNIALSFHRAAAAVTRRILEKHGHQVRSVEAPHERMFRLQEEGAVDILVSAWLPSSHDIYLSRYADRVRVLTPHYEPYCVWAVPPYVPEEAVGEVADLLRPEVAERMTTTVQGINPGAGISRFSARMVREYGLDRAGYGFVPGSESEFVARVDRGVADREWFVVPLWRPQYLNRLHGLRSLTEPKGLLGTVDAAAPVVTHEALDRIDPAAVAELDALRLGNEGVEEIDSLINVDGLPPLRAADRFLAARR
ncbi:MULTISPECIES: glycine betaine ABC transporter substrate-binding protein [Streptomyces]|uniref:Glycine betaine/proline transport system substrate-binding protein n=2 Tax=Streptomyces TaxID=1883 RepID=A0ABT9L985_STRGD|nr:MULTISPECIES: glycine betaine ABC transporter substrate-binding protein [Streptomyces]MDP9680279.1 glycine betaine/proline transport system substrate-binding protein [Streptomyces griseoviridis]GGT09765.1 glycine/betaine ABC transporter [Streptomyces griseoviridis]GGU53168.1 glycine/betaine ABC transporter [Streptomyces daghestanicus]GHI29207.1 glycine/betaine ABC transporter [Streptomyces daghestanicus]